jgi:hypothetical protein
MDTVRIACVFRGKKDQDRINRFLHAVSGQKGIVLRREAFRNGLAESCFSRCGVVQMRIWEDKVIGLASFYGDAAEIAAHPVTLSLIDFLALTEAKGTMQYMWGEHCNTIHFQKGKIAYNALCDRRLAELDGMDLFLDLQAAKGRIAILLDDLWQAIRAGDDNRRNQLEKSLLEWQQRAQMLENKSKREAQKV